MSASRETWPSPAFVRGFCAGVLLSTLIEIVCWLAFH